MKANHEDAVGYERFVFQNQFRRKIKPYAFLFTIQSILVLVASITIFITNDEDSSNFVALLPLLIGLKLYIDSKLKYSDVLIKNSKNKSNVLIFMILSNLFQKFYKKGKNV
jgi:TRAP-type C4-dicarboxylate transport system permease large subunit